MLPSRRRGAIISSRHHACVEPFAMRNTQDTILIWLCLAAVVPATGFSQASARSAKADPTSPTAGTQLATIQEYSSGLAGVHAANPEVKLRVDRDSTLGGESVLLVDYPAPNDNPGSRDVRLDAANTNWSAGRAISFRVRPEHATRLSVRSSIAITWCTRRGGSCRQASGSRSGFRSPRFARTRTFSRRTPRQALQSMSAT